MTKLRKAIKLASKRRAHRKNVSKRKMDRLEKNIAEETRKTLEEEGSLPIGEAVVAEFPIDQHARNEIGDLIVTETGKHSKRQLSRKQMKRKAKNVEKGIANSDLLHKKWVEKKHNVRARAKIRGEE